MLNARHSTTGFPPSTEVNEDPRRYVVAEPVSVMATNFGGRRDDPRRSATIRVSGDPRGFMGKDGLSLRKPKGVVVMGCIEFLIDADAQKKRMN